MMHPVAYFDLVFLAAVLFGLVGLIKSWKSVLQRGTKLLLAVLLVFMGSYGFCLGLEWSGITEALDTLEDFIGALIPMWWAFVFYAFVHEITHRDIRESEEKYRSVVANIPGVVWTTDENGRTTFISSNVEMIYGYTPEEIYKEGEELWIGRIHPDDVDKVKDAFEAVFKKGLSLDVEYRIRRRDGEWIWLHDRSIGAYERGGLWYADGVFSEITGRKRAEEQLQAVNQQLMASEQQLRASNQQLVASEQQLRASNQQLAASGQELRESQHLLDATINNSPAVIYVKNLAGCYLLVNKSYEEILGISCEEMLGKTDEVLFPKDVAEKFRVNDERALESEFPLEFEEVALHANGELHTYISTKFSLRDSSGSPYAICGISTDITERKRLEDQERKHHEELVHFSRLTVAGELASGMAHELNQPLTAIANYAMACQRMIDLEKVDLSMIREATEEIAGQAMRGGEIIRRMRDFVRKQGPQRVEADFNEIVREAVDLVKMRAKDSGATLQLEFSDKPLMVFADKIQIEQVLVNLLQNGFDSMAQVKPCDRVLTVRTSRTDEDMVEIAVEDRGAGLSGGDAEKVFESFFTTKADGLGIGLSISRSIVEEHEGRIWATPNPQKGTTFRVALPAGVASGEDII